MGVPEAESRIIPVVFSVGLELGGKKKSPLDRYSPNRRPGIGRSKASIKPMRFTAASARSCPPGRLAVLLFLHEDIFRFVPRKLAEEETTGAQRIGDSAGRGERHRHHITTAVHQVASMWREG